MLTTVPVRLITRSPSAVVTLMELESVAPLRSGVFDWKATVRRLPVRSSAPAMLVKVQFATPNVEETTLNPLYSPRIGNLGPSLLAGAGVVTREPVGTLMPFNTPEMPKPPPAQPSDFAAWAAGDAMTDIAAILHRVAKNFRALLGSTSAVYCICWSRTSVCPHFSSHPKSESAASLRDDMRCVRTMETKQLRKNVAGLFLGNCAGGIHASLGVAALLVIG